MCGRPSKASAGRPAAHPGPVDVGVAVVARVPLRAARAQSRVVAFQYIGTAVYILERMPQPYCGSTRRRQPDSPSADGCGSSAPTACSPSSPSSPGTPTASGSTRWPARSAVPSRPCTARWRRCAGRLRQPGRPRPLPARRRVPAACLRPSRGASRPRARAAGAARRWPRRFGETVHYAVLDGREVVYRAKVDPPAGAVRLTSTIGGRNPAHCTAVGKLLLAYALPDERPSRAWVARAPLERRTPHTVVTATGRHRRARADPRARLRARRPGERAGHQLPRRAGLPDLATTRRAARSASAR